MTTTKNLVLLAILILGLILMFRRYSFRIHLVSNVDLFFSYVLSGVLFFSRVSGGGQPLSLPDPSGSPSSSSIVSVPQDGIWRALEPTSTEMEGTSVNSSIPGVARDEAGPSHSHQTTKIVHNFSLESSIKNRI